MSTCHFACGDPQAVYPAHCSRSSTFCHQPQPETLPRRGLMHIWYVLRPLREATNKTAHYLLHASKILSASHPFLVLMVSSVQDESPFCTHWNSCSSSHLGCMAFFFIAQVADLGHFTSFSLKRMKLPRVLARD